MPTLSLYDGIPELAQAISFFRDQGFEPSAFAPQQRGDISYPDGD
jgi:hypothetical protein